MSEDAEKSLYERVGGYDTIAAFVDDLLPRVVGDPEIGVYWRGHCNDTKRLERQLTVDFICEIIGGPVVYRGRNMKTSHEGLDISQAHWEVFMRHTIEALNSVEIRGKEMDDCLAVVENLSTDIVEAAV